MLHGIRKCLRPVSSFRLVWNQLFGRTPLERQRTQTREILGSGARTTTRCRRLARSSRDVARTDGFQYSAGDFALSTTALRVASRCHTNDSTWGCHSWRDGSDQAHSHWSEMPHRGWSTGEAPSSPSSGNVKSLDDPFDWKAIAAAEATELEAIHTATSRSRMQHHPLPSSGASTTTSHGSNLWAAQWDPSIVVSLSCRRWMGSLLYGSPLAPLLGHPPTPPLSPHRHEDTAVVGENAPMTEHEDTAAHTAECYCKAVIAASGGHRLARDYLAGLAAAVHGEPHLVDIALHHPVRYPEEVVQLRDHLLRRWCHEAELEEAADVTHEAARSGVDEVPSAETLSEKDCCEVAEAEPFLLASSPIVRCFLYDVMCAATYQRVGPHTRHPLQPPAEISAMGVAEDESSHGTETAKHRSPTPPVPCAGQANLPYLKELRLQILRMGTDVFSVPEEEVMALWDVVLSEASLKKQTYHVLVPQIE